MAKTAEDIQIGALSARTGVHVETIRYYERVGVLPRPPRSAAGYRRYGEEDIKRLGFIRRLRELRFSLEIVQALLDLAETPRSKCGEIRAVAAGHLSEVRTKIADLHRMEQVLKAMVASCDRGIAPKCPIIETLWRE
ncbi:MAG: helix-turn-helix domain-containing protein [Rhodomicrobium sp.]|nr:helix-turn-helix domain-containing protein [Rhodomicrobium sp.]